MKHRWTLSTVLLFVACGPSYGGQDVKTSEEWIAEEEAAAAREEREAAERGDDTTYAGVDTDEEQKKGFDRKQAEMELKRATRSAASCPGVVADQETPDTKQRGTANVTIRFEEDGTVSDASIGSPFADTPVGQCVLNAYEAVIVPPFQGGSQIIDWQLELKDPEKEE